MSSKNTNTNVSLNPHPPPSNSDRPNNSDLPSNSDPPDDPRPQTNPPQTSPSTKLTQIPTSTPYPWPHNLSLRPSTTALLIIDMQHDFLSPLGYLSTLSPGTTTRFTTVIPIIQRLLHTFRLAAFPVLHTREGHAASLATVSTREAHRSRVSGAEIGARGPMGRFLIRGEEGHGIVPELAPVVGEVVIDKPGRGAFAHTELDAVLRAKGVRNLVVCGVTADACVSSTVREASDRGFDVLVVEDGVESVSEGLKEWSLEAVRVEGGLFGVTADSKAVLEAVETWIMDPSNEESQ